jgi:hypothetical protein
VAGLAAGLPCVAGGAAAWGGPAVAGLAAGLPGAPGGAWPSPVPAGTAGPSMVVTGAAPAASNETPSQAYERFEVPANPSDLRTRKARRRGGYAPRPPQATRTAPASVDVDLTESGYELV